MKKVLIIRMSALGDVAMTIPVIYAVAHSNPSTHFTVMTQPFPAQFFINAPANISVIKIDVRGEYNGVKGIMKLITRLSKDNYDAIADLHDVLRSKIIRTALRVKGARVESIDKDRRQKKELTSVHQPIKVQLKSSFERYADVFTQLGFTFNLAFTSLYDSAAPLDFTTVSGKKEGIWIGFAPFAKHKGKIYPLEKSRLLVKQLASNPSHTLFLYGAGAEECAILEAWENDFPRTKSMAGKIKIHQEIAMMSYLDVMVSMDSANMHLASLVGTPVVSIWGATHPYAGFLGWNQSPENAVGLQLACRPCSIFGNKPCRREDFACLNQLPIEAITTRINAVLYAQKEKTL